MMQTTELPDLLELEHIRQTDIKDWGGKSSMLGELLARGFPIPQGICLSTPAYRKSGDPPIVPSTLEANLQSASERLLSNSQFLAVRSSAGEEDSPDVSYAGVYKSVIGVSEPDEIAAAVQTVWQSYTSPSTTAFHKTYHQENSSGGMGVLIQPVIRAEVAGVCFSLDPVQPRSHRVVINANWGLGAGVVDGSLPADTYWLQRDNLAIVDRHIVEKQDYLTLDEGVGLIRKPVKGTYKRIACLPDDWAHRIAQFAMATERVFGQPQDVEWAIEDGEVWILQSRPITTLDSDLKKRHSFPVEWKSTEQAQRLWTRTRFEQNGNAPLLPLDIDYVRLKKNTRVETCLAIGADYNEDLLVVNGQIFTSPAPMPIGRADLRIRNQAFRNLQERLNSAGLTAWNHWGPEIELANLRLTEAKTEEMEAEDLANFLEEAMAVRSRHNMLHPMMWFKPNQSYFDAYQALSGISDRETVNAAYRLLDGGETPLTQIIDELYNLATQANALPDVANWIRMITNDPTTRTSDELPGFPETVPGAVDWQSQFWAFLSQYGDRNGDGYGSEALINTPTWRERPIQVIHLIANYLGENVESPSQKRRRSGQAIEKEIAVLCDQCSDSQITEEFLQQLSITRKNLAVLEIHNYHIEQVSLGQLHRAVLAASGWLQSVGLLSNIEDIFWITFSEILSALRNPMQGSLEEIIQTRKTKYHDWMQYEPPPYLGLPSVKLPSRSTDKDAQTQAFTPVPGKIRGIGASAGTIQGRARVIESGQSSPKIEPGDILIAENAGPLWLPFFPVLGGMVLEVGSLGQHAATTAREYGIPAVMAAANATRLIKDGDWITIDGQLGLVEIAGN